MIVIKPPVSALTPPPRPGPRNQVLPIGDSMSVCESAGMVSVELYGQVVNGRMRTNLTPADAARLGQELLRLSGPR